MALGNDDEPRPDYNIVIELFVEPDPHGVGRMEDSYVYGQMIRAINEGILREFIEQKLDTQLASDLRQRVYFEVY